MSITATGAAAAVPGRMRTMSTTRRAASNQKPRAFSFAFGAGSVRATRASAVDRDQLEDGAPGASPGRDRRLRRHQRRQTLVKIAAVGLVARLLVRARP